MDRYIVGIVLRPHGVRGAIKIEPLTDNISRFKKLTKVYIEKACYKVLNAQVSKSEVYLTLDTISDRNAAELLRNKKIEIDKQDAVPLEEGRYFIVDLISSDIVVNGRCIGKLIDVLQNRSADVYVVEMPNRKTAMFPALKKLITNVDIENKTITLDEKVFEEVVVYEDWSTYTISRNV